MPEEKERINHNSALHDLFMAILGCFAFLMLILTPYLIGEPAANYPFYKGPEIFPIIILSIMTISSLPAFYRLIILKEKEKRWYLDGKGFPILPLKILLTLILIFLIGFIYIGLELSCFLFFITAMYLIGCRLWWKLILYPTIYTTFILVLFKYMLDIYFPEPLIFSLWGG